MDRADKADKADKTDKADKMDKTDKTVIGTVCWQNRIKKKIRI